MAPDRPAWIVKDLAELLGFDQDSISQLVIPDLETYTSEAKLKAHLQDFLGPGPQTKAFISKYLSHQFPRLPTVEAPTVPAGPVKPLFSQPARPYSSSAASVSGSVSAASGRSGPGPSSSSGGGLGFNRQPPPHAIPDALEAAFGSGGGKVYQKNRDADQSSFGGSVRHGSTGTGVVGGGSGSTTPRSQQPMRHAGAVTILDARASGASASQKGKQRAVEKEKIWDAPKSGAVKKLEKILEDLRVMQRSEGKVKRVDEGKECFCQARLHPLSAYTPQCAACGLIQCHTQPPDRACPSCLRPLITPSALARLLQRVQTEIEDTLAAEQYAREEIKRADQRKAEVAASFPYLAGTAGAPPASTAASSEAGHKVLTIGKGKGRITLTTTTTYPVVPAAPAEPERYSEAVIARPRSPPLEAARVEKELAKTLKWREAEDRPWGDLKAAKKGTGWAYVEQQIVEVIEEDRVGRRKGRKGKGTAGVDGRVVPGASGIPA